MSDLNDLADRTSGIIDAITGGILSSAEAAAERIQLAAEVAKINTRMEAFGSVLETIEARKQALEAKLETAGPTMKKLIGRQLELLTAQETSLLERVGVTAEPEKPRLTARRASGQRQETLPVNGAAAAVHGEDVPF